MSLTLEKSFFWQKINLMKKLTITQFNFHSITNENNFLVLGAISKFLFEDHGATIQDENLLFLYDIDGNISNFRNSCDMYLKKFPCPKCSSVFKLKGCLTRHLKYECQQAPRFACPFCEFRTKKTSHAYEHVRRRHPNEQVFIIDLTADPQKNIRQP